MVLWFNLINLIMLIPAVTTCRMCSVYGASFTDEYPGALYYVTSLGNAGKKIVRSDKDRVFFLELRDALTDHFSQPFAERPLLSDITSEPTTAGKTERNKAMHEAHVRYGYTMKEIADQFGIHYGMVSRIVKKMSEANV